MARTIALAAGTLLFTLLVPLVIGLLVPLALVQRSGAAPTPWWPLGAVVAAGGATLYVWCAASFVLVGRGTPAPDGDDMQHDAMDEGERVISFTRFVGAT